MTSRDCRLPQGYEGCESALQAIRKRRTSLPTQIRRSLQIRRPGQSCLKLCSPFHLLRWRASSKAFQKCILNALRRGSVIEDPQQTLAPPPPNQGLTYSSDGRFSSCGCAGQFRASSLCSGLGMPLDRSLGSCRHVGRVPYVSTNAAYH